MTTLTLQELDTRVTELEQHVARLSGEHVEIVEATVSPTGEVKEELHAELVKAEGPPPGMTVTEWLSSMTGSPGIVVDPTKARATPCIRMELGEGRKDLVYSEGIIGALDEEQKALYCQEGYTEREVTPAQRERIETMERAAKSCSTETEHLEAPERIHSYFACLGRELKSKGQEVW
jgi:hypothetical protein